ncbi:hypothetical protein Vadar_009122 [Vaccinium darrowii]|uniref:Uncharacterized protein n=1 Tax=Vaccinium darrowii TaxID=229202 RepID=A0ACB7YCQ9_9ERIC|nr:hypothetical protein Vadar_009122 [Vaccinium darrowii]
MALCNSKSSRSSHFQIQQSQSILFSSFTIFLSLLFPSANSISFNLSNFNPNGQDIKYQGYATPVGGVIQLTNDLANTSHQYSVGRATYAHPIHLWDSENGTLTDFNTQFSFIIQALVNVTASGDGLAFFLSPLNATIPNNSFGGFLGLFEDTLALNNTNKQIVAVEFDTVKNFWDPSSEHVGIDVNEIVSVANVTWNTSSWTEVHNIVSWNFSSTLGGSYNSTPGGPPSKGTGHKTNLRLMVGLAVGVGALICGVGLFWFMKWKQIVLRAKNELDLDDSSDDDDLEEEIGPKRFTLVDHGLGSETTVLAGTPGYLAPEYATTGKASKESDVYSFGIVALEIACGRKPVELTRGSGQVELLEWVWSLYGKGQLYEAIDKNLSMEYDEHQVERLMVVGLSCCHPDFKLRPSIRQAINILTFETLLPVLPSQKPVAVYLSPLSSNTTSTIITDSDKDRTQRSSTSHPGSYYSSLSVESSKAPLQLHEDNEQIILL